MALQKTINLPTGDSGDYLRITSVWWDRAVKQASAHLSLYKSAALASGGAPPQVPIFAKLRLTGAKFDEYLSPGVLAALEVDVVAQLYAAAKVEPVVSDFGGAVLADATDV
tara:strand:- start:160 stop:492 length:333 start_codon:yes stop_codon:yes gene_type:complete